MARIARQPNPKYQSTLADSRNSAIGLARCMVPGCSGFRKVDTDGNGGVVEWCTDCEERVNLLRAIRSMKPREAPIDDARLLELIHERLATIAEVAQQLGVSEANVSIAITAKRVDVVRFNSRYVLVWRASVERWRSSRRRKQKTPSVGSASDERAVLPAPRSEELRALASSPEPLGDSAT